MHVSLLFLGKVDPGHFVHRIAAALLFVGKQDWAHSRHRIAAGLRGQGVVAHTLTAVEHPFGYARDLTLDDLPRVESVDWLATTGDENWDAFDVLAAKLPRPNKGLLALHTGSKFRAKPKHHLSECRKRDIVAHFYGCDLYRLHDGKTPAFPTIAPSHASSTEKAPLATGPLVVAHSPTDRYKKGTQRVVDACKSLHDVQLVLLEGLSHAECVAQRGRAHLVVDQVQPKIGGFGSTSVEAMASGQIACASLNNCITACWEHIERPPILDVRSAEALRAELKILRDNRLEVLRLQEESLAWARRVASPEAVARYWIDKLGALG